MKNIHILISEMIAYYAGDPKRIQHFLKVHSFAKLIGETEKLNAETLEILETAAIVHDIGIKVSEEKYHSSAGKYQELEGPAVAEKMLRKLQYDPTLTERVCWLVGHHHTYDNIQEIDHQILVEADFLVNIFEDGLSESSVRSVEEKIFKTKTGKQLIETIFLNL